jgi:hypothetical protein
VAECRSDRSSRFCGCCSVRAFGAVDAEPRFCPVSRSSGMAFTSELRTAVACQPSRRRVLSSLRCRCSTGPIAFATRSTTGCRSST